MIRIVLAGEPDGIWRPYRQPQWMARVRDAPEASTWPRQHFDMAEDAYLAALTERLASGGWPNRAEAMACLGRLGAVEVRRG